MPLETKPLLMNGCQSDVSHGKERADRAMLPSGLHPGQTAFIYTQGTYNFISDTAARPWPNLTPAWKGIVCVCV